MKLVREHIIFEKFTEDSDPVRDMEIGIIKLWKEELINIVKDGTYSETAKRYYNDKTYYDEAFVIHQILKKIVEKKMYRDEDIQIIFDNNIIEYVAFFGKNKQTTSPDLEEIIWILNNKLHMNIINSFKFKTLEKLQEIRDRVSRNYGY